LKGEVFRATDFKNVTRDRGVVLRGGGRMVPQRAEDAVGGGTGH
jgi:hypothetical protein